MNTKVKRQILAADGTPLKVKLAQTNRRRQLRARQESLRCARDGLRDGDSQLRRGGGARAREGAEALCATESRLHGSIEGARATDTSVVAGRGRMACEARGHVRDMDAGQFGPRIALEGVTVP